MPAKPPPVPIAPPLSFARSAALSSRPAEEGTVTAARVLMSNGSPKDMLGDARVRLSSSDPSCVEVAANLASALSYDFRALDGSACTSASLEPSYVLRALGVDEEMAHTSIRYGLGRFTTEEEVDRAIELTAEHVAKLREMSPLWEMVQEGIDLKTIQWSQH